MPSFDPSKFSHIRLGFRGAGVFYRLQDQEIEFWSTWIRGRRLYLDNAFKDFSLGKSTKRKVFQELLEFFNAHKEKPIIVYTSDSMEAPIWKELCLEFRDLIEGVESRSTAEVERAFYNSLKANLKTGQYSIEIDGYTLKSVADLKSIGRNLSKKGNDSLKKTS